MERGREEQTVWLEVTEERGLSTALADRVSGREVSEGAHTYALSDVRTPRPPAAKAPRPRHVAKVATPPAAASPSPDEGSADQRAQDSSPHQASEAASGVAAGPHDGALGGASGGRESGGGSHGALAGSVAAAGRGPGLLATRSPCAGYFPRQARAEQGEVKIEVEVDPSGRTRASTVLAEHPRDQGFASAARACAARLRFAPALSAGAPVSGRATLRLTFRRG